MPRAALFAAATTLPTTLRYISHCGRTSLDISYRSTCGVPACGTLAVPFPRLPLYSGASPRAYPIASTAGKQAGLGRHNAITPHDMNDCRAHWRALPVPLLRTAAHLYAVLHHLAPPTTPAPRTRLLRLPGDRRCTAGDALKEKKKTLPWPLTTSPHLPPFIGKPHPPHSLCCPAPHTRWTLPQDHGRYPCPGTTRCIQDTLHFTFG